MPNDGGVILELGEEVLHPQCDPGTRPRMVRVQPELDAIALAEAGPGPLHIAPSGWLHHACAPSVDALAMILDRPPKYNETVTCQQEQPRGQRDCIAAPHTDTKPLNCPPVIYGV